MNPVSITDLRLQLEGFVGPGKDLHRQMLFDQICSVLPGQPDVQVLVFNAEIAPGGYTNRHCHNGATFFLALQGQFEAHFDEGVLVRASAGDVYSEPIGRFHRGHNPHPTIPYLCIGFCVTPVGLEHVTVDEP